MAARMDTEDVVLMLNDYFAAVVECVFRHEGTIDKFIGDALLVVFGSPEAYARMEFTIIGDPVNMTTRYCAAAGKGEIMISPPICPDGRSRWSP